LTPDTTAPIVTIDVPEENHNYTSSTIWLNTTANENIANWWYNINNIVDITFSGNQSLTLPDGIHDITVIAQDIAGNNGSSMVNFSIDTIAPAIVTGLAESDVGSTWVGWLWTNPLDSDFKHTMVYMDGVFKSNITDTSYMATNLSESTSYTISTRTVDIFGNVNSTWSNCTAMTELTPSSDISGSHISIGQSMPPQNVIYTDSAIKKVLAGTNVEYAFSDGKGSVLGISFDAKDNKGNVVAKVQVLKELPEGIESSSSIHSYQEMSITVGKEGTVSKDNADNILIKFKVNREWIKMNNIDISTIHLSRYHDDEWNELPTNKIGGDDEFIYLVARTPGFSIFQVTGDELAEEPVVKDASESAKDEGTTEIPTEIHTDLPGFIIGIGLAVLGAAGLLHRKGK